MKDTTAKHLLQALLAEKGIPLPAGTGDPETDAGRLLERALAPDALGNVPDATCRALAETFDAIATASEPTVPPPRERNNTDRDWK